VVGGKFTSPNATVRLGLVISSALYVDSTAQDWTIDSIRVDSTAECGVIVRGSHGNISRFRFDNCLSNGIILQNAEGPVKDVRIWAGQMNNIGDTGIEVASYDLSPYIVRDVWAWGVMVNSSTAYGFSSIGGRNIHFRNCKALDTGLAAVFFGYDAASSSGGAADCSFQDGSISQVQGANKFGVVLYGNSSSIYSKQAVSTMTYAANVVTVTFPPTVTSNPFEIGDPISISGATETGYNVNTRVVSTTLTTIKYYVNTAPSSPATGTPTIGRSGLVRNIQIVNNEIQAQSRGLNAQFDVRDVISNRNLYAACDKGILVESCNNFDSIDDRFDNVSTRAFESTSSTAGRLHVIRPRFLGINSAQGAGYQRMYVPASANLKDVLIDEVYDDIEPGTDGGYGGGIGILIEQANARIGRYVSFSSNALVSNGSGGVLGTTMRLVGKGNTAARPTLTKSDNDAIYYDTQVSTMVFWNGTAWS
jgi:hypothetical protein